MPLEGRKITGKDSHAHQFLFHPLLTCSFSPMSALSLNLLFFPLSLPTPVFLGFPGGSAGKESTYNAEDLGSIPRLGRSPGDGKGYPLQYSGLENSIDCIVCGVAKNQTRLSDFH